MDLSYLDRLIPKRWVLLLRYYLPFFKRPAPLHFKLREFINKEQHARNTVFNLTTLFDLLVILDSYSQPDPNNKLSELTNLSDTILDCIIFNEENLIKNVSLKHLIEKFDSKISNAVLNQFFNRLPKFNFLDYFLEYITTISQSFIKLHNSNQDYQRHINYCTNLRHKFNYDAKLRFFLSIPDELIANNLSNMKKLINLKPRWASDFLSMLDLVLREKFSYFMTKYKKDSNFNQTDLTRRLLSLLSEGEEKIALFLNENSFYTKEHFIFLKKTFINTALYKEFLQVPQLIDQLIIMHFDQSANKALSVSALSHFSYIEKVLKKYPLNLFQMLAIHVATKKNIDSNVLAEKYDDFRLNYADLTVFSPHIQILVLENVLKSLQVYINNMIIEKIDKKPEKINLHHLWHNFSHHQWTDRSQPLREQIEKIFEKIPPEFKTKEKASLDLFKQLYDYLEMSPLKEFSLALEETQRKQAIDDALIEEEKEKIRKQLRNGLPVQISYQRMEELFGAKADSQIEQWQKNPLISFFNGNDKEATRAALAGVEETEQLKELFLNAQNAP